MVIGGKEDLLSPGLVANRVNWVSAAGPGEAARCEVQIRYQHRPAPATLAPLDGDRVQVAFDEPQPAVTPGQAAVFYDEQVVLGGGWIDSRQ